MTKKDNLNIKRDYLNKITQIQKYNKAYFIDSRPLVDDSIYDKLKIKVLELEKKYDFLKDKDGEFISLKKSYFFSSSNTFILSLS